MGYHAQLRLRATPPPWDITQGSAIGRALGLIVLRRAARRFARVATVVLVAEGIPTLPALRSALLLRRRPARPPPAQRPGAPPHRRACHGAAAPA